MNWKEMFGFATIIFSFAFLTRSLQFAYADIGPSVSLGEHPYESFYGTINNTNEQIILTVPSDRKFVITTMISNRDHASYNSVLGVEYCLLNIDGSDVIGGNRVYRQNNHAFTLGNAHLSVNPNSQVKIIASGSTCRYYVEGYYVRP